MKIGMYGTSKEKIEAHESLLKSDLNLSPEQRRYLKNEINKEKRSIERAKKVSPGKSSPLKMKKNSGDEYRENLFKLQSSAKKLGYERRESPYVAEAVRSFER